MVDRLENFRNTQMRRIVLSKKTSHLKISTSICSGMHDDFVKSFNETYGWKARSI